MPAFPDSLCLQGFWFSPLGLAHLTSSPEVLRGGTQCTYKTRYSKGGISGHPEQQEGNPVPWPDRMLWVTASHPFVQKAPLFYTEKGPRPRDSRQAYGNEAPLEKHRLALASAPNKQESEWQPLARN